jgi:BASS family bile acid:Na+ symporter
MNELDQVVLHFDQDGIFLMNVCLGFVMFGVALQLTPRDFYLVFTQPKAALLGFFAQFIALPFITFLLVLIFQPAPSLALGMMLVAACPGGNISNFLTSYARGNAALSVSMTAVASLMAVFMTPLNIALWGGWYAPTAQLLTSVQISFAEMAKIVAMILIVPMMLGMAVRHYKPTIAHNIQSLMQYASILIFGAFVALAFYANFGLFVAHVHVVLLIVLVHNGAAILTGLGIAKLSNLPIADQKTLAIETGIQNSGLGLGLIFAFFNGMGGMAIVAGWWGIWHILSGLSVAYYFRKRQWATT